MDDSDAGAWADLLLFPPWIADERDGTLFRNLPRISFQRILNGLEGCGHTDAPASPAVPPFHDTGDSDD